MNYHRKKDLVTEAILIQVTEKARLRETRNGGVPVARPEQVAEKSLYSGPLKTDFLLDPR